MEVIPKKSRHFTHKSLEVKPSGPPSQDPYTKMCLPLVVVLRFNCF